jgi:AsmA protein
MKKVLIFVGLVLALVLAFGIILPFVIDINAIVAGQIPKLENSLHREIDIGEVRLTVLTGLGAEIKNVKISNHPDFKKENFVSIDRLQATVQLLPLLKKEVLVSSIAVEKPQVLIEKNAKGVMNFFDMIPAEPTEPEKKPGTESEPKDPLAALKKIHISKISLKDGNFTFIDASEGKTPKEIKLENLDLSLKAVSLSQKISIDFNTDVYASPKAGQVALSGDIGPIGEKLEMEKIPMDLTLTLNDINLPHLASSIKGIQIKTGAVSAKTSLKGRFQDTLQCHMDFTWDKLDMNVGDPSNKNAPASQINVNGDWQLDADISGSPTALVASGNISLDKSAIRYGKLFDKDSGIPLFANAAGRIQKNSLRIDDLKITLSKMALTANADIVNFADPLIDGKAAIAPAPLNALAPILPALKAYELQGIIELSDARFKGKMDELKNLKGVSGNLTIRDGSATSAELGKKIEKIQAAVSVADNVIAVTNTSLKIDASDATINATIRNPVKPDITFSLASSYLDVDALLSPQSEEKKKSGSAKESKPEPAAGAKTPEKKKAPDLKATGNVSVKKCKYNKMIFDNVSAELLYADAVATLKNLTFDTFGGNVSASAKVHLADMDAPQWSADLATRNIDANTALSQFTSIKDTFYGTFNADLSLQGKGAEWTAISKDLAGTGSSNIVNGKLAKVNVLDAVGQSLLKFQGLSMVAQAVAPGTQKHLNETEFNDLAGKFNITEGKILLDALTMSAKDFKLSGAGFIGLDKNLDVNAVLTLSKSASERFQNDKVMKYLLNKDQLLEVPCAFKGDVTSPRVTADGDSLNRLMQNAAAKAAQEKIGKKVEEKLGKDADKLLKGIFK